MKNVKENQLKKCIFMEFERFEELIDEVTNGLKEVVYEFDGFYYEDTEKADKTGIYWNEYIEETLSKHFDVTVTSIHADDCDILGVWIVYK